MILNSYSSIIEDSLRENRSYLKLINFGTGSGKTHQLFQAMYATITKYSDIQIVGVYVAPLREHLHIPPSLKSKYSAIPVYTINSLEMKTTGEHLNLYKQWLASIINNKAFWSFNSKGYVGEKTKENQESLSKARKIIGQIEFLKKAGLGDEELSNRYLVKAIRNLNNLIESFLEFIIKCKGDESNWPDECLKLMEIFYPLHLLRKKSGIILLTYKKFETSLPYFRFNGENWIKQSHPLPAYVTQHTSESTKFILAFDEQEDGYQIMLNSMVDVIAPQALAINNALSSINREFSVLFSAQNKDNRKLLDFIEKNPGAIHEFEEYSARNKVIAQEINDLAQIYQRLTHKEGNSPQFIERLMDVHRRFKDSLLEVSRVFDEYHEEKPIAFDFDVLYRVLSKFENNRSLLIPFELFQRMGDDLLNIFTYNNVYIYNIEPLRKLFITRSNSGHVRITDKRASAPTSLADLIYVILAIRLQIAPIKDLLTNVVDAEDSQSRALKIWSRQVSKVQKASAEDLQQARKSNYLNRAYVYEGYKSIINIMEISRYQDPANNLVNDELREVSIGTTAILTSPEKLLKSILAKPGNMFFLISATGGISGDLSTSYDMSYLEDNLRDNLGRSSFRTMTEQEIQLCETIRHYRQQARQIFVNFFSRDLDSLPNVKTRMVVERFEKTILKNFTDALIREHGWLGAYKVQELKNFIRFVFYLFEDDSIQETFALTQTLYWIKGLIHYCRQSNHINYIFEPSSEHPDIYYVRLNHNSYSTHLSIKIILFSAAFNTQYYEKDTQRTYLDELHEKEGEKIFFVSAYPSASKGLNPVITTQDGKQKDFDSLVLLMDSYFTAMKPDAARNSKEKRSPKTKYHFAVMKGIVRRGESIEIKKFNEYLRKPEAQEFGEQQHQILLGKGILQSIGRVERRDYPKQITKLFINEESQKNLTNFYRYLAREERNEIRKLSANNYQVYLKVQEEERKYTIADYEEHVDREINATLVLQSFRHKLLDEIERFHSDAKAVEITRLWEALRNPIVFSSPSTYLENLRQTGLFPSDFIDSLFYINPNPQGFVPYLASEVEGVNKFQIISDAVNGERLYFYLRRLYPEYLKIKAGVAKIEEQALSSLESSTGLIYRWYKHLIPQPEVFETYIPRPHFFYDVLYPSLTENFVESWIHEVIFSGKDWDTVKSLYGVERLLDFKQYHKLYERFDLYYIRNGNELFCIDVKAWSAVSGNRLSKETLQKARRKVNEIRTCYPQFSKVKGLLLNLQAMQEKNHQHSPNLFSGSLVFFDGRNYPVESSILRNFLFAREQSS
jgi:hypothetical protein